MHVGELRDVIKQWMQAVGLDGGFMARRAVWVASLWDGGTLPLTPSLFLSYSCCISLSLVVSLSLSLALPLSRPL